MYNKKQTVRMVYFEDVQDGIQPVSPGIIVDGKEIA